MSLVPIIVFGLFMEKNRVKVRFAERVLIPQTALPLGCMDMTEITTDDDVRCAAHFLCGWDNSGGRYNEELNGLCQRQWDCSFDLVRNIWRGRLEFVGDVWHYIELKKIEK